MAIGLLFSICFIVTGSLVASESFAAIEEKPLPPLTMEKIMKRMEASSVTYNVNTTEKAPVAKKEWANVFWPKRERTLINPWSELNDKGQIILREFSVGPECRTQMGKVEDDFQKKNYKKALDQYLAVFAKDGDRKSVV